VFPREEGKLVNKKSINTLMDTDLLGKALVQQDGIGMLYCNNPLESTEYPSALDFTCRSHMF